MKNSGLLTGVLMVVVFAAGIFLGYYFGTASNGMMGGWGSEEKVNDGSATAAVPEEGIKLDSSTLSDGQRKMLEAMGIDTENITLTPEMVACAEAKVGSARLIEIQNGASPSVTEGAALAACYQ